MSDAPARIEELELQLAKDVQLSVARDKRIEELELAFAESDADCADKEDKIKLLESAGRRSLNWLASYPRGGMECDAAYRQMRAALNKEQT